MGLGVSTSASGDQNDLQSDVVEDEVINFEPSESYALCLGLDKQASEGVASLGKLVERDCRDVGQCISRSFGVPEANVKVIVSSDAPNRLVSVEGVATLLVEAAWKVGPSGVLIFAFFGHGIRLANNHFTLALVNHSSTAPDYIVADDIARLILNDARFKGRRVLLVLDCCLAGAIPQKLMQDKETRQVFRAIAACNSYESSIQLLPLQHSVFTYFLLKALQHSPNAPGELHLKQVYEHIHTPCRALSSLFIQYNPQKKSLDGIRMSPRVFTNVEGHESVDANVEAPLHFGRLHLLQHFWTTFPAHKVSFSSTCHKWLAMQSAPTGPLQRLRDAGHLEKEQVLNACLSAMCHSIACLHLYDNNPAVGSARQFIKDFTEVYATVESVTLSPLENVSPSMFESGIVYYYLILKGKVKVKELKQLYDMIVGEEQIDTVGLHVCTEIAWWIERCCCIHVSLDCRDQTVWMCTYLDCLTIGTLCLRLVGTSVCLHVHLVNCDYHCNAA